MTEPIKSIEVDASTLQHSIEVLGAIGQQPEGGIVRPVYSPAWVEAREHLATFMHAAGLDVRKDAMGNLFGRLHGRDESHTLLTGSHFDTVPLGGKFDGALGILAGIVALQALHEHLGTSQRSLEVVALCEEEGSRFPAHCWGTKGNLGLIDPAELEEIHAAQGITIAEAMRAVGLAPERYREAIRTDLDAFFELHIEQGRILFDEGIDLGIVTAITGLQHVWITVKDRADHAGTTPMEVRHDALHGAAHMAVEVAHLSAFLLMCAIPKRRPCNACLLQSERSAKQSHKNVTSQSPSRSLARVYLVKWILDCKRNLSKQPRRVELPGNGCQAVLGTIVRSWSGICRPQCCSCPAWRGAPIAQPNTQQPRMQHAGQVYSLPHFLC
jgi:Peptidase family M20/M25/M40